MALLNGDMVPGCDGGHRNAVFNSGRDFFTPRSIVVAALIPPVGPRETLDCRDPVRLRGIRRDDVGAAALVASHGARIVGKNWVVDRADPFPFDELETFLPRMARRSITVDIIDLIPRSEWYASLANLMVADSWDRLGSAAWANQFVCYECGSLPPYGKRLDCHEVWWYNAHEVAGEDASGRPVYGVRRLRALRMLCPLCHEMQHLGNARRRGHFERAFARLGAVNRINWGGPPVGEAAAYSKEIHDKYKSRNRVAVSWNLDLAAAAGIRLQLRRTLRHAGGGVIVRADGDGSDRTVVRIVNADIRTMGGHVWVEPRLAPPRFGHPSLA